MSLWHATFRFLASCVLLAGLHPPLSAQAFQSSFSEVKFDRAKAPVNYFSAVQVDVASGAASLDLPCGPGIGERGLRFRPTLSLRMAPQLGVSSVRETHLGYVSAAGIEHFVTADVDTLHQRGYGSSTFNAGTFDLALCGATGQLSTYALPGGGGGTVLGQVPAAMTPTAVQALLLRFGLADPIAALPGYGTTPTAPFIAMGSTSHLVVGLGTEEVRDWPYFENIGMNSVATYHWPRRLVVVQGEVAIEYTYVSHRYTVQNRFDLTYGNRSALNGAHFVATRMLNRFGESIVFNYDGNGLGYQATWRKGPMDGDVIATIRVAVQAQEPAPTMPSLTQGLLNVGPVTPVLVTYEGINAPVPQYRLVLANVGALNGLPLTTTGQPGTSPGPNGLREQDEFWGEASQVIQPVSMTQQFLDNPDLNETVSFDYGPGPASTWDAITIAPTVLRAVTFPTRKISLEWEAYRYKANYSPDSAVFTSGPRLRPDIAYGVHSVGDSDLLAGAGRATFYTRVVPVMNWATSVPLPGDNLDEFWVDPTFYTAVTGPDGLTVLHRFQEPGPANQTAGGSAPMSLGYLKHLEQEVRYFASGVDWRDDLAISGSGGNAYRVVVADHYDARSVASPAGFGSLNPAPYATRTRTWDRDSQTLSGTEIEGWSDAQLGWTQERRVTDLNYNPDLTFAFSKGSDGPLTDAAGTTDVITRSLDNLVTEWLFGRVIQESTTRQDHTGHGSATGAPPPVSRILDPVYNTVTSITTGGSDLAVTTLLPHGSSGVAAAQVESATLVSPGLAHSGLAGVQAFSYDANGFLAGITLQTGTTTLPTSQTQDALGRVLSQTDADGRTTTFGRDAAGRLTSIQPPGGDLATTITYSSNHRQVTVTQGARTSEYIFNAFGEQVLERRKDPDGAWSHRIFGYNGAGNLYGTTLWLPGAGADRDTWWAKQNLFNDVVVTTPGGVACKKWGPLNPDTGERDCLQWQTVAPTTTTFPALASGGTRLSYDSRSRVIRAQDAAGVVTATAYPVHAGFLKVVTVASQQATSFLNDSAGRLMEVTDALGQVTRYHYDASNRLTEVRQYYSASGYQGRTWTYNSLGWLTSLVQPESGLTLYEDFTVQGAPGSVNYNGRVVRTTRDRLGRPLRVDSATADARAVHQSFTYDPANGKGQMAESTDGVVSANYGYADTTGRLSRLTTTAVGQTFVQSFTYDGYGQRTGGNNSHAAWAQTYHDAAGLPQTLTHGGVQVATTGAWSTGFNPVTWLPQAISYANGASSAFEYGTDQQRLGRITHRSGSNAVEDWSYGYDALGRVNQVDDRLKPGWFDAFGYDDLNRLISALTQSQGFGEQLQTFAYDTFGNRVKVTSERVTGWTGARNSSTAAVVPTTVDAAATFTLDPLDPALLLRNQLPANATNGAATGKIYDDQGNLTQVYAEPGDVTNVLLMAYDDLGRVIQVQHLGKGTREDYGYRADGLRTVIDAYQSGTYQKTRFQVYNDLRQLVAQYEKAGAGSLTWKKDIAYLGTQVAGEIDASGITVTQVDHLGTPRVLVRPGGQVVRQKYLPFGESLDPAVPQPAKGFTNHEQTDVSGLIYMQARFYLPMYGRFASPDPARDQHFEETQSWNIFSYVQNNPVMMTDPSGMFGLPNWLVKLLPPSLRPGVQTARMLDTGVKSLDQQKKENSESVKRASMSDDSFDEESVTQFRRIETRTKNTALKMLSEAGDVVDETINLNVKIKKDEAKDASDMAKPGTAFDAKTSDAKGDGLVRSSKEQKAGEAPGEVKPSDAQKAKDKKDTIQSLKEMWEAAKRKILK